LRPIDLKTPEYIKSSSLITRKHQLPEHNNQLTNTCCMLSEYCSLLASNYRAISIRSMRNNL